MAGSKKWFVYTPDSGQPTTGYGILLDESNTEAINGTAAAPPTAANAPLTGMPKTIKPRRIYYQSNDGNRVISCVALNTTIYNSIPANFRTIPDPIGGGNLTFVRKSCEKFASPNFGDTGLTDGDN